MQSVVIVGGGLAGSEAAWQLVRRGIPVCLYEMRPKVQSPAHQTDKLAELVCSNSLGSDSADSAAGLLKEELRALDSIIMKAATKFSVPAGKALAVDREKFSQFVTETLLKEPLFTLRREEVTEIPDSPCIIASGPLTSATLAGKLQSLLGQKYLYFFDAVSPVIELESVNMEIAYRKDRYAEHDGGDYINCPMDREQYGKFYEALVSAERAPLHDLEKEAKYFEGCMPVEVIASRGRDTMRFGPLRPVGLENPKTGSRPYAVVQLRQDNREGTLCNIVGFQTNLRWGEQKRVFRMIPGLERAEFVRMGVMHRNIYVDAPRSLDGFLRPKSRADLFLAGQITGVEGYVESTAMGVVAALGMHSMLSGKSLPVWPSECVIGALLYRLNDSTNAKFNPTNANMGIFPPLFGLETEPARRAAKIKNREQRNLMILARGREKFSHFLSQNFPKA